MTIRVRFTPSPTSRLHVRNVRTALYNWFFTQQPGGAFVLRFENTDLTRSQPACEASLLEHLKWLRLDWNKGMRMKAEHRLHRQGERREISGRYAASCWKGIGPTAVSAQPRNEALPVEVLSAKRRLELAVKRLT